MAPKKKEHSNGLRTLVINHYLNCDSQRKIAKKLLLSRPTVQSIIKYKITKCIGKLFGRGRKPKTTSTTDRLIQRKLKLDRRKSARAGTSELEKGLRILISESTVKRRAHEVGLFGRVARKKPYVNRTNLLKRLKYAKEMLRKPLDFWDTIVWSDESKFNLVGSDGRTMVQRSRDEEFDPKCTVLTVKHRGGSVTVWGSFTKKGVGELVILDRTMDRFYYRPILEENLLSSVQRLGLGTKFIFMHDNDPKHTSALVKDWLRNNGVQAMQWPSSSRDFNSTEHLWDVLEDHVKTHHSNNKTELTLHLMEEWSKVELSALEKLVDSVPSRLNESIRVKGYATRY